MSNILEICVDASLRKYEKSGRIFTCSGAISINSGEELYTIDEDSTNNRGELIAAYLGLLLANKERYSYNYDNIAIYSDSQFVVYGLTKWMHSWVINTRDGIIYNSNKTPVKNQELFKLIISYCINNNMRVHFYAQRGHTNFHSSKDLAEANDYFYDANGFILKPEDIFKISFYNDIIDKNTRKILKDIHDVDYPIKNHHKSFDFNIPYNFGNYIIRNYKVS